MKRILFTSLILLVLCSSISARAKYQGIAGKGGKDVKTTPTTKYELLETYPACTVTVYLAGTLTLANIFSDNAGTIKANPFTANTDASYFFYADNGRYDVKFSGTGIISPYTLADILLSDPIGFENPLTFSSPLIRTLNTISCPTCFVAPSQAGNSGKFLSTDGTTTSWQDISSSGGDLGLVFTFSSTNLWDNGYWISRSGYNQHSSMARAVFQTSATSVSVDVFFNGSPDPQAKIAIWVNGVPYAYPLVPASGANTVVQSLPAGNKQVEIVSGVQAIPASNPLGIFLIGCTFNGLSRMLPPISNNRLLVYGDSNAQGGGGSPNVSIAWPGILRTLTNRSIVMEALSGRTLNDDTNSAPIQTAFVAKIAAINPAELWIAIGTNDYNAATLSAANFATAYGSLLDEIHTALPNLKVYCQSPIIKGDLTALMVEAPNAFGNNLHDYRDKVREVAEARGSYATYVEGLAIVSLADMRSDAIHVSDLGNHKYAKYVRDYLLGKPETLAIDTFASQEDVVWTSAVNVTVTTNSLQKTGGVNGAFDAGAISTKAIVTGNGWARFTITETNTTRVFGLSKGNTGQGFTEIDYAFGPQGAGGLIGIFENGTSLGAGTLSYLAGDKFQIRVAFPKVYYERIRAGVVKVIQLSPAPLSSANYPLLVDTSLSFTNATITDAKIYGALQ